MYGGIDGFTCTMFVSTKDAAANYWIVNHKKNVHIYVVIFMFLSFFFFFCPLLPNLGLREMFENDINDHKRNLTQDYLIDYLRSRLLLTR